MQKTAAGERRRTRPAAYLVFFLLFALVIFLSHASLVRLPYFWDESGQFIPAGLDILHGGHWIPESTRPNIHPPGVMAYLAAAWSVAGFHPATTRCAMLLLASFGLLAAFLLAIELSRELKGTPALLAAAFLCASPLFFAQAMLAQLDAPAMLLTTLALLFFLQDRLRLSLASCVMLVLVKETGVFVPLVFAAWLGYERRWRDAAWFALPVAVLAGWIAILTRATGSWAGNPDFVAYNVNYAARPARLAVTLLRRIYCLGFANLHWVGAVAILFAWRRSRIFQSRSWRVAWLVVAAQVAIVTVLGGAVLERYLLPVMPILYAAMAAGLSIYRRPAQVVCALVLLAGLVASNFINPPYPFAYENNLAFTDFIELHQDAAGYIENLYPLARVQTAWPLTAELSRPELGFVDRGVQVESLYDFSSETLESLDWSRVQVLVTFSRTWNPKFTTLRFGPVARFWRQYYGYVPNVTQQESRKLARLPVEAHFERRGQWVDIYVNPALWHALPKEIGVEKVTLRRPLSRN